MKYSYQAEEEDVARIQGTSLPISTKTSVELCSALRGLTTYKARLFLQNIIDMKKPLPMNRFNKDRGHKPGIGPGRFPVKAAEIFLQLVGGVEKNAFNTGLDSSLFQIVHISANKASRPHRYGRQRGRKMKRTHIQIVVKGVLDKKKTDIKEEIKSKKEEVKEELKSKKEEVKKEIKSKKEEVKEELKSKKEEIKEEIKSKKEEVKKEIKSKKEEIKEEIKSKKEEIKEEIKSKKEESAEK